MTHLIKYIFQTRTEVGMFNMITGINELKTLTKHVSCNCKCKFGEKYVIYINSKIYLNENEKWKIFSKYYKWFSNYVWWNYRWAMKLSWTMKKQKLFQKKKVSMFYLPFY